MVPTTAEKRATNAPISVPAWGWVGSDVQLELIRQNIGFSSPSGDGLVLLFGEPGSGKSEFSSPSGDGLVHGKSCRSKPSFNFRPRLGMGWFRLLIICRRVPFHFRPRLGMGWFVAVDDNYKRNCKFSAPSGDGLVRDYALSEKNIVNDFRPRVGMGWFIVLKAAVIDGKIFVPAWGWVGS